MWQHVFKIRVELKCYSTHYISNYRVKVQNIIYFIRKTGMKIFIKLSQNARNNNTDCPFEKKFWWRGKLRLCISHLLVRLYSNLTATLPSNIFPPTVLCSMTVLHFFKNVSTNECTKNVFSPLNFSDEEYFRLNNSITLNLDSSKQISWKMTIFSCTPPFITEHCKVRTYKVFLFLKLFLKNDQGTRPFFLQIFHISILK